MKTMGNKRAKLLIEARSWKAELRKLQAKHSMLLQNANKRNWEERRKVFFKMQQTYEKMMEAYEEVHNTY